MSAEQKLCLFYIVLWVGTFADCLARGADSLFGRLFCWLATL